MDRWKGRVALVTGASAGIGAATCKVLVSLGMKVVGCARNVTPIEEMIKELQKESGSLTAIKCDLSQDSEILAMFASIKQLYGGVDVCINNAGISVKSTLLNGTPEQWRQMLDVNVVALCLCTKEAIASMKERGVDDGQIIHISSMSGHRVVAGGSAFYAATKHAVNALTEGLRAELRSIKSHIRVAEVCPGFVETEFAYRMLQDPEAAKELYSRIICLQAEDIAASVVHILSAPQHVQIHDIMIRPTEQIM